MYDKNYFNNNKCIDYFDDMKLIEIRKKWNACKNKN